MRIRSFKICLFLNESLSLIGCKKRHSQAWRSTPRHVYKSMISCIIPKLSCLFIICMIDNNYVIICKFYIIAVLIMVDYLCIIWIIIFTYLSLIIWKELIWPWGLWLWFFSCKEVKKWLIWKVIYANLQAHTRQWSWFKLSHVLHPSLQLSPALLCC